MNIHGHCKVELTDVKTGNTEVQEHGNLITKALHYFYKPGGITNPTAFNSENFRENAITYMLGGLMCLDTALTESNEIIRVPTGVGMTANGAKGILNSGSPTELGSYNETESGWQQDGSWKMVWDWTTSQGNGDIKCVCLTSILEGYKGIGNKSLTNKTNNIATISTYNSIVSKGLGEYPNILGYANNKLYVYNNYQGRLNNTLSDRVNKMIVNEYAYPFTVVDVRDSTSERLLNSYEITIPSPLNGKGAEYVYAIMDAYCKNGISYILVGAYYNATNPTIADECYVLKLNLSTHAFTECIALTASGSNNNIWGISDKWVIMGKEAIEFDNSSNTINLTDDGNVITTVYDGTNGTMKALSTDIFEGVYNRDYARIMHIDMTTEKILHYIGVSSQ